MESTEKSHRVIARFEAPDQGDRKREREAPENPTHDRRGISREAPDAGIGHLTTPDSEFTHGRSQS
jgi:hypothetical protein